MARKKKVASRPRARARTRLTAPARALRLWVDVSPGPYGVLFTGADPSLRPDDTALEAIAQQLVFPSLDLRWSLSPEAAGTLSASTDLEQVAEAFGRARRAFLHVELQGPAVQVLGLYPQEAEVRESRSRTGEAVGELVDDLVPILVPIAGPLGALVKGAGVLFRAALGSARRRRVEQLAYQRDDRSFGWCFERGEGGAGLLEGLHRATALLAVPRDQAALAGSRLEGRLQAVVDIEGAAQNVFLEHRFALPLETYAATRPAAPSPKIRQARKAEELPLLLTLAEAAAFLGAVPADLWREGAWSAGFDKRFLSYRGSAEGTPLVERDSFLAFVRKELLRG